jgi:hypothetical protein
MSLATQINVLSDGLFYEEDNFYSREVVTISGSAALSMFTVVAKVTATGKYVILAPAAADGSQTAAGVLLADADATSADVEGLILARHAIVKASALIWPNGITANQKTTAINNLVSAGILVRTAL